ncbi:hemin receptor [Caenimonas sedimenti]|uniref:Hemin receptor n=1 Tax=Caenimonas sedimenti TaxID=2596921 RepID=A0A562ZVJ3_9BURK|nr:globin family protein [Caenimonas sedimenti]TWO72407.1 hemin receptor [Caenimonas sedimenti]
MNETQIQAINRSFAAVLPISDAAAAIFYQRLFELRPAVRPLFQNDLHAQGRKLMHTIGTAVGAARNLDALRGPLQELAKRHAGYGVRPEHFDDVGTALIHTLEQGLGSDFTAETRQAWIALYGEVAGIMRPALEQALRQASGHHEAPRRPRSLFLALAAWFGRRAG